MPDDDGLRGSQHQVVVLVGEHCPVDQQGDLVVYKVADTGRIFLMCDEAEETWWSANELAQPPADVPRNAIWVPAGWDDVVRSGWDEQRFELRDVWSAG